MKKPENKTTGTRKSQPVKVDSFSVDSARIIEYNGHQSVVANIKINGVTIYGVNVIEGKNGDFLSFPQKQGKDGKYYHIAYVSLSDEDQAEIIKEIENVLNK